MRWFVAAFVFLSPALWGQRAASMPASGEPLPPLSLADAEWLTDRAQLILEHGAETSVTQDLMLARLMVQSVIDYVQLSDQRRSTLTEYEFVYLGKTTLETVGASVEFTLTREEPLPQVQAIALQATRVPVRIESMIVETRDEEDLLVLRPGLQLDPNLPGRSFLYLPEPMEVRRVTVTARTESDFRPRVKVWLGQAPRPEFLRQALYHLTQARGALEQSNAGRAAAELEQARRLIARAQEGDVT